MFYSCTFFANYIYINLFIRLFILDFHSNPFELYEIFTERAIQGGVGVAQQKLLVRLVTRLEHESCTEFEDLLMTFIVQEQKSRTELALLWIAELYAQFQGYCY